MNSPFLSASNAVHDQGQRQGLSADSPSSAPGYFPADLPVSFDAAGAVVSRYGDSWWDLSGMSTDGTSQRRLHFHASVTSTATDLDLRIQEQQKALMWLHIDAGKTRAAETLASANYALTAWCERATKQGVDLYTLLTNPEWVTLGSQDMNLNYVYQTNSLIRTLWRHRQQLGAPADLRLQSLKQALKEEARSRPESQQTPLIPSRVYSSVLGSLLARMTLIEGELDLLLDAFAKSRAASLAASAEITKNQRGTYRAKALADVVKNMKGLGYDSVTMRGLDQFIAGRLGQHQVALMLVVTAFTGMRKGEVSILPLVDVLTEFEHMGQVHHEVQGVTHKLNKGIKRSASWITSYQGARAVRLAQRIAQAILQEHDEPPKVGQAALLFPSKQNPYKKMAKSDVDRRLKALSQDICPVIEQVDIEEMDRLELARGWARDDIEVGKRWPLAFHQLRRSLAVYAHRSGMVSLPALKAQLQHITQEMTSYYADGFSRAVNLVFDKQHFSHEWQAAKAESSYYAYALGILFSDEGMFGQGAQRMANTVESRSRQDTLRLFEENKLAYHETPLGGCVSTEDCKTDPLEPIPYHCLETNCVNLVVFSKRLAHVIKFQEVAVATLELDDAGSVEHRLEARHLEVLLKARDRLKNGAK